jgi:guanine deaminase
MKKFMRAAVKEAFIGVKKGHGGPFGAVITRKNKIIAKSHNMVTSLNDPTAHAEVIAIRRASKKLGRFNLSDCEIYSTCEPCPMCLSAIHWARIGKLYYGCTREDAERIGFDDNLLYLLLKGEKVNSPMKKEKTCREECLAVFMKWSAKKDKIPY